MEASWYSWANDWMSRWSDTQRELLTSACDSYNATLKRGEAAADDAVEKAKGAITHLSIAKDNLDATQRMLEGIQTDRPLTTEEVSSLVKRFNALSLQYNDLAAPILYDMKPVTRDMLGIAPLAAAVVIIVIAGVTFTVGAIALAWGYVRHEQAQALNQQTALLKSETQARWQLNSAGKVLQNSTLPGMANQAPAAPGNATPQAPGAPPDDTPSLGTLVGLGFLGLLALGAVAVATNNRRAA